MQADYVIKNGRVVNVYSGEVLEQEVAVAGRRIIEVAERAESATARSKVIDAAGDYLLPGFFDAHAHADLFTNPLAYCEGALARGTTGIFNDGHDLAAALGPAAFLELFDGLAQLPFSIYTGVPAAAPPYPQVEGGEIWGLPDLEQAFSRDYVLSLSEVTPFLRLIRGAPDLAAKLELAKSRGRLVEGHTTGASPAKLNRLAAAGVSSCHESLSSADVLRRLRLGFYVMLRQGSIRQDLPHLMEAVRGLESYDLSRLMLVSDGIFPDHLLSWGNMDWVVAQAVSLGIPPVRAVQMASLNPARYFRLDHLLGGLAPGRLAHILIAPSLERPTPRLVMASGVIAAVDGALRQPLGRPPAANLGSHPFTLTPPRAEDLRIPAGPATPPVISVVDQTVTQREDLPVPVEGGFYAPSGEVMAASLFSRDGAERGRALIKGFCPGLGGLASSAAHEVHGLLVAGQSPQDMAQAAAEVVGMGGGIVLVQGGQVRARLPLGLGGICSLGSVEETARGVEAMHAALRELGCTLDYPLWSFVFLPFTSVLRLRITYQGVFDVREGRVIWAP